jgi:hypothetical protein
VHRCGATAIKIAIDALFIRPNSRYASASDGAAMAVAYLVCRKALLCKPVEVYPNLVTAPHHQMS